MTDGIASRPMIWDDISALHEMMRAERSGVVPHVGHFYWALRGAPDDDPLRDMRGWFSGDALAAVAWLDPPNAADAIIDDDRAMDDVLDWLEAEQRSRGGGSNGILAQRGDGGRIEALRRRGYKASAEGNVRFRRRLDAAPKSAALAPGFSLRHVANDEDFERRVSVENAAYGGSTTAERWRLLAREMPDYRPELDVVAIAADGSGVAACTCWYDESTRRGEVEAVGTAKEYQRLGLGRVVVTKGLQRLHELGAREAILYTSIGNVAAMALYRSCGFEVMGEDYAWVKRA